MMGISICNQQQKLLAWLPGLPPSLSLEILHPFPGLRSTSMDIHSEVLMHRSSLKCTTTTAKTSRIVHAETTTELYAHFKSHLILPNGQKGGNVSPHIDEGGNFAQPN